jgi:hypothetical protein
VARLAVVGWLMVAACTPQAREPFGTGGGGDNGGGLGSGGGGTGGGGSGNPNVPSALVGRWENTLILQLSDDIETVTTTWTFDATGSCAKQVRSFSVVEGFPRTSLTLCRFDTSSGQITITFNDTGGVVAFHFSFPGFSPDRLLLDDIEFQRLP